MVKYLGSLAHPMATSLMGSVKDGGSVILEITLSYYWDYLLILLLILYLKTQNYVNQFMTVFICSTLFSKKMCLLFGT